MLRTNDDQTPISDEDPRHCRENYDKVLKGEKPESMDRQQIKHASKVLIKRRDSQRIDCSIEGVLGLPHEHRKNSLAPLKDKIRQHIRVPQRVARADLSVGRKWTREPQPAEGEEGAAQ